MKKIIFSVSSILLLMTGGAYAESILTGAPKPLLQDIAGAKLCLTVMSETYAKTTCEASEDISIAVKGACNQMMSDMYHSIKNNPYKNGAIDTNSTFGRENFTRLTMGYLDAEIVAQVIKTRSIQGNCN